MANPQKKIVRAGASVTTPSVEGKIVEYVDSQHVLDPNDPLAVQVPRDWYENDPNPLNEHLEKSPNEVSGDDPQGEYVNPHTGEVLDEAKTPSPTPDNVESAKKLSDVQRPGVKEDETLTGDDLDAEKVDTNVIEATPAPDADEPNPEAPQTPDE